jgi:hypothetical protein
MLNWKGGLAQSTDEIKTKTKQDVAAPADYNEMLFKLEALLALIEILFGDMSITAGNLRAFIHLIKSQSILYKGHIALDNFFPWNVLWTVCTWFQLFLDSCTHEED